MGRRLKTTRPVAEVRTIDDIVAIERHPYDELVTARNLYDLFLATTQHAGGRKALTVLGSVGLADIPTSWTHRELLSEITRAANMFRAFGIGVDRGGVAFLAPTIPRLPPLLLGAQIAGIASSLNYLLSEEAIIDLLNAQTASLLVIPSRKLDEMCWSKAARVFDLVPSLRHVIVVGDETENRPGFLELDQAMDGKSGGALDFEPTSDRDTICALFHTGGTTGRPKLVQLTHGNQIHAAFGFAQVFGYDEYDIVINGFPFFHVGGTMTVGLSVLAAGGHVVVPSPYALRPQSVVERYWDIVRHFKATVVSGVPTSIAALTNAWRKGNDASSVRMAVTGGAVLPKAVGSRFETTTGIRLFETYGMTETAAAIAFNPGRGEPVAGSVGLRAPYSQTRIVPLDQGSSGACAVGESGLVQVRGPQVFPGYLDPAHNLGMLEEDGWLTTGDVGYMTADERLFLTGREKDLIVRSGHNIDPAAIEDVANQFPGVQISAAVGMPDQYAGEVPALFVVPVPGSAIDLEALKHFLEGHVNEPPARPKSVLVIDALPVTAVGKIFKPALRDMTIKEKVCLDVERICCRPVTLEVTVGLDESKRTLVYVGLSGVSDEEGHLIGEALKPLPQTYVIRLRDEWSPNAHVLLDMDDGIATLTLNRPESRNALSHAMMTSLKQQLHVLAKVPDLRAVLITGSGSAFCAGGDLIEFENALLSDKTKLLDYLAYNQDVLQLVEDLPVPVIGAVNGVAVAGGLELLLCCDMIIAAEGVKIGDGHVRYGIVPAGGATVRLPERLSPQHAAQLFYTGEFVTAERGRDLGLVNEVVPAGKLMPRAFEIAREISVRSPEAIRHIKSLTRRTDISSERSKRIRAELEHFEEHLDGADLAKGLAAFRNKQQVLY